MCRRVTYECLRSESRTLETDHPVRIFVQALINQPFFPVELKEHYQSWALCEDSVYKQRLRGMNGASFGDFVPKAPCASNLCRYCSRRPCDSVSLDSRIIGGLPIHSISRSFQSAALYVLGVRFAIIDNECFSPDFAARDSPAPAGKRLHQAFTDGDI
jgi:hypothetical protein